MSGERDVALLRELVEQAAQVIEWCGLNDKTPKYGYGDARPNGDTPGRGKAFNTPREFAAVWTGRLRDALSGGGSDA